MLLPTSAYNMSSQSKLNFLFFLLGIALTLFSIVGATAISGYVNGEKASNLNSPAAELSQNQENERDIPSPKDFFSEEQIRVYKDRVILDAENIQWASFEDTKSMLPIISNNSNALQIIPNCPDEIQVGDIVSYRSSYAEGIIIHRVAFIGNDNSGTYFILKGDNNPSSDPGKVRCSQIDRKVVAIIY